MGKSDGFGFGDDSVASAYDDLEFGYRSSIGNNTS